MSYKEPGKNAPPPYLELSHSTIYALQQIAQAKPSSAVIDLDNVLTLWTTLANSSQYIRNGQRLENISWRVVNRSLLSKQKFNSHDFSSLLKISLSSPEACRSSLLKLNKDLKLQQQAKHRIESANHTPPVENGSKLVVSSNGTTSLFQQEKNAPLSQQKDQTTSLFRQKDQNSSLSQQKNQTTSLFQHKNQTLSLFPSKQSTPLFQANSQQKSSTTLGGNTPLTQSNLRRQEQHEQTKIGSENGTQKASNSQQNSQQTHKHGQQNVPPDNPSQVSLFHRQTTSLKRPSAHASLPEAAVVANHTFLKRQPPPNRLGKLTDDGKMLDDQTRHLYEQQRKYNGAFSPKSDTQKSQVSLFGPPRQVQPQEIDFSSSDDSSEDSGWSSLSDDSEFDDEDVGRQSDRLLFRKKALGPSHYEIDSRANSNDNNEQSTESPSACGRKSLLSGLFLNGRRANAPALNTPINQRQRERQKQLQREKKKVEEQPRRPTSPKLVYKNEGFPDNRHSKVRHSSEKQLDLPLGMANCRATASASTITTTVPKFVSPENPRDLLKRHSSAVESNVSTNGVSKPGLSLTSLFGNGRNSQHSEGSKPVKAAVIEPSRYDLHHHSNAPPTATTLLPTALATHMFLPTMSLRQQARARHREPNQLKLAALSHQSRLREVETRGMANGNLSENLGGNLNPNLNSKLNVNTINTTHSSGSSNSEKSTRNELHRTCTNEFSSSVKTSTSSIDIPGSEKRHVVRRPEDYNVPDGERKSSSGASSEHHDLAHRSSSSASRMSAKSTRLEMLSKELPIKLMDSINNENRLLFNKRPEVDGSGLLQQLKRRLGQNSRVYDSDFDGHGRNLVRSGSGKSNRSSHRSRSRSRESRFQESRQTSQDSLKAARNDGANAHNGEPSLQQLNQEEVIEEESAGGNGDAREESNEGSEQRDEEGSENIDDDNDNGNDDDDDDDDDNDIDDDDYDANSNIIADGIMGNKLKFLRSHNASMHKTLNDFTAKYKGMKSRNANGGNLCKNSVANGLLFSDDGYVDDRLIRLKARVNGVVTRGDEDNWDEDNMSYHARGW